MNNKTILGLAVAWLAVATVSTCATHWYFQRQVRERTLATRRQSTGDTATADKKLTRRNESDNSNHHQDIRTIIAEYSVGRRQLEQVLSHYDNGTLDDADRAKWQAELNRRWSLLTKLEKLSADIPAGADKRKRYDQLSQVLKDAISVMERFAANESKANRAELSAVSQRNSETLRQLKKFYGVR